MLELSNMPTDMPTESSAKEPEQEFQKTHSFPSFHQSLPMVLLRPRDAAMLHFRPIFSEADLTEQQWRVIRALYDAEHLDMSNIAKECHIMLPSVSGIIKRLEARALVKRSTNANDQRSTLVSLTQNAKALIENISPQLEAKYLEIEQQFGKEKLERLYSLCFELEEFLGQAEKT